MPAIPDPARDWQGKALGLPASGPRSLAGSGRRVIALIIDWSVAVLIGWLAFDAAALANLAVFAVLQYAFIATLSGSIGHLALGMRVVPVVPKWIGPLRPLVRTLLLCLVIPAVIWDKEGRGLHDVLAGTVLVRR